MASKQTNPSKSQSNGEKPELYADFQIRMLFEGLCEQVLDYKGIEQGRDLLYKMFPRFKDEVDVKVIWYARGYRITRKQDKPDPEIMRICDETTI